MTQARPNSRPPPAGLRRPLRARAPAALLALAAAAALASCSDDTCGDVETAIGLACTPEPAGADRMLVLEVREACGTNCARSPSCTAVVSGGAVRLSLHEDHCFVGSVNCDSTTCSRLIVPCTLPALREGDYPLIFQGGPSQILRVRQGGAGICRLPRPPPAP